MSIYGSIVQMEYLRPFHNVGCLFDHMTAGSRYVIGARGESILSGGQPGILTIAGPGNSNKTTVAEYFAMTMVSRYGPPPGSNEKKLGAVSMKYDSENSGTWARYAQLLEAHFPELAAVDWGSDALDIEERKFFVTTNVEQYLDEWWETVKKVAADKNKSKKGLMLTTPFILPSGAPITTLPPTSVMIDSMSRGEISEVLARTLEKADTVGGSETNMYAMGSNKAKGFIINAMPKMNSASNYNMSFISTAHVGSEYQLDSMAPRKPRMTHRRRGTELKNTSKNMDYINTTMLEINDAVIYLNATKDTGVMYPKLPIDRTKECKDLIRLLVAPTRNKAGASGGEVPILVSQREGVLPHLSQYEYIVNNETNHKRWGVTETSQYTYAMDLYPDVKFQRTTIRPLIDSDSKLRRAIEITSDMLQIENTFPVKEGFVPTPAELREKLSKDGYDWDILLNTRSWWTYLEFEKYFQQPFLSTWDLLRMYHGQYRPFWYK